MSIVAIVGRPNVGKSTLFNRLVGMRKAIVNDTAGTTRDRHYGKTDWNGREFSVIDTGGYALGGEDIFEEEIRKQVVLAVEEADVILFLVEVSTGITDLDMAVADLLRRTSKKVILVVNKVDNNNLVYGSHEFYALGLGDPFPISATNMLGLGDLLDEMVKHFPQDEQTEDEEEHTIQIAVIGRPNVGKSSLVNRILGQERSMVSGIAGTTRDAIDTAFVRDGQRYNIIDTAGIRRKRAIEEESIERYSIVRALAAVRRCDVALIVINAEDGVTEQDTKVAGYVHDEGKAAIIVVNKWDALEKDTNTMEAFRKKVIEDLKFMDYAPVLFISALTGQRVPKVLESVREVYGQTSRRITTGLLNDILADATTALQPPYISGRRLKIYYATQQSVCPPTFVLFVNDEKLMHFAYQRYLENQFRKSFGFEGTPIRFILRNKNQKGDDVK